MFSLKAQKLFVESASLDLRSVYFYPISMQKCSLLCLYWEVWEGHAYLRHLFTKKNPLHVHEDVCIGFFRRSMMCCYFFRTGSQVRLTPNFWRSFGQLRSAWQCSELDNRAIWEVVGVLVDNFHRFRREQKVLQALRQCADVDCVHLNS